MKKLLVVTASTVLVGGLVAAPVAAEPTARGFSPQGCALTAKALGGNGVNSGTPKTVVKGKCGGKKVSSQTVWGANTIKGSGKIKSTKFSYKFKATYGSRTGLSGKIGSRKVSGSITRAGNAGSKISGQVKYRGKSYKYSYRFVYTGNPDFKSVSVKRGGKKVGASNVVRIYLSSLAMGVSF